MKQLISMLVVCLTAALWGCGGAQQDETTPEDETGTAGAAMPEGETAPDEGPTDPETTEEVIETSTPM